MISADLNKTEKAQENFMTINIAYMSRSPDKM